MKSRTRFLSKLGCCLLVTPFAQAFAAGTGPEGPTAVIDEAGSWAAHDTVVKLHDLPKDYSCNELEERFRDVLLALGARPDMKVEAHQCAADSQGYSEGYAPRVHLQFSVPRSGMKTQTVPVGTVRPRTVRLGPGAPRSWTREDCKLMLQVKDELLLKVLPEVISFSLACDAPPVNSEHYNVTVQAIEPARAVPRMASAAAVASKPLSR